MKPTRIFHLLVAVEADSDLSDEALEEALSGRLVDEQLYEDYAPIDATVRRVRALACHAR